MVRDKAHLEKILEDNIEKGFINLPIKVKNYNKISNNILVIF